MKARDFIFGGLLLGGALGYCLRPVTVPSEVAGPVIEVAADGEERDLEPMQTEIASVSADGAPSAEKEGGPAASADSVPVLAPFVPATAAKATAAAPFAPYLPSSPLAPDAIDVLETLDAPGHSDPAVVHRHMQARRRFLSEPEEGLRFIDRALASLPGEYSLQRETLLGLAQHFRIEPARKAEFYLQQAQRPLRPGDDLEAESERVTALDYFMAMKGISNEEKERGLHAALAAHQGQTRLQRRFIRSFAVVESEKASALAAQYGGR